MPFTPKCMPFTAIVVDDSAVSRALLKRGLQQGGVEVVAEATTGEQALQLYDAHRPTLVVFDIVLPKMDGVTAATMLLKAHPDVAVVMCSALAAREKILACREAGVSHFLLKPVSVPKIAEIVERIIARLVQPPRRALAVGAAV